NFRKCDATAALPQLQTIGLGYVDSERRRKWFGKLEETHEDVRLSRGIRKLPLCLTKNAPLSKFLFENSALGNGISLYFCGVFLERLLEAIFEFFNNLFSGGLAGFRNPALKLRVCLSVSNGLCFANDTRKALLKFFFEFVARFLNDPLNFFRQSG